MELLWSLVVPPDRSTAGLEQDLFLLWPGEVVADAQAGAPEPARARYVEERGFSVIAEGRPALSSPSLLPRYESGVAIPREGLARIVPGPTTDAEVVDLFGPAGEVVERLATPGERTLTYRSHHIVPLRRAILPWLARVTRWDVEDREVEITVAHGVVRDAPVCVRRARAAEPGP